MSYDGFFELSFAIRPLFHGLPASSRNVNQMNICTRGSFATMLSAVRAFAACVGSGTAPDDSGGFVWYAYSVIHIGVPLRWNNVSMDVSNFGIDVSDTFGHLTRCVTGAVCGSAYGWCAQASKRSAGRCAASSWANLPGEWVSCVLVEPKGLSRPRGPVSPIATCAVGSDALI